MSLSPLHAAVWDSRFPSDFFAPATVPLTRAAEQVMQASLDVVRHQSDNGTLHDANGKLSPELFHNLAAVGYWGLTIERVYGGSETPFSQLAPFLTQMALLHPTVAALAAVHGCIGAAGALTHFGTPEQKQRLLPPLARGERLSAFCLTEPGAGSDLTAIKTTAQLDGNEFVVTGEKIFITNLAPGRTVALVCLVEGRPAVLICELPWEENEHFQLRRYGLWAAQRAENCGLILKDFRVPAENLLSPPHGDGLTIAYAGLNRGRIALCANVAGSLRRMLASMVPWVHYRQTYGSPIAQRELVARRLGRMASLIVGSDALVTWSSALIQSGRRGEMECIVAKCFASEAIKEGGIELMMRTHGGRSFLHGHPFGDHVHEFLAPSIYEGEGELLSLALFKSLVKQHSRTYFEPLGKALAENEITRASWMNPRHMRVMVKAMMPYWQWLVREKVRGRRMPKSKLPAVLRTHARWAAAGLQNTRFQISRLIRKHGRKLADRQCLMSEMSIQVQKLATMLCTCFYAGETEDPTIHAAADVLCRNLAGEIQGQRPQPSDYRAMVQLGEMVANGEFKAITGVKAPLIQLPYHDETRSTEQPV